MTGQDIQPIDRAGIGLFELFLAFGLIGLSGFGGVLPFARHALVERRRWLTPLEFLEILSLSQFLPGPNVVILAVCFGMRARGAAGAAAAFFGLLAMPVAVALVLVAVYAAYVDVPEVQAAFRGVAAAAAGLLVSMAVKLGRPVLTTPRAIAVAALVFGGVVFLRLPLIWVLIAMAPISVMLAWWRADGVQ